MVFISWEGGTARLMFYAAGDLKRRVAWVVEAGSAALRHGFSS